MADTEIIPVIDFGPYLAGIPARLIVPLESFDLR